MADYLTKNNFENILFEPLFCKNGCINGKGITSEKNMFERKEEIFNYFKKYPNKEFKPIEGLDLTRIFIEM
jgi:iron only hydrogenase large subunit-like protein